MSGAQSGGGVPFGPPPALCEHNKRPQQAVYCPSAEHRTLAVKLPCQLTGDGAAGRVAGRTLGRYQQYLYISIA